MTVNLSETQKKYPLSPKKIFKKSISGLSGYLTLFIIFFVSYKIFITQYNLSIEAIKFMSSITLWVNIISVVIILYTIIYQYWYFVTYYYEFSDNFIVIKKDPITPREVTIPFERIQDVYVDQDLMDRLLGLYDVHLSSATISSGYEAHIDGVEKASAEGLKTDLLNIVRQRISKNKAGWTTQ